MATGGLLRLWNGYKDSQETDDVKKAWKLLCKRKYHLHCAIVNKTKSTITFQGDYFDSGAMLIGPPEKIYPGTKVTFGVGGGSSSGDALRSIAMGGVSGGAAFKVGVLTFSVGFTDPIIGYRKVGVSSGTSAKDGYNAASEKGGSLVKDGYGISAQIDSENRRCTYTVCEAP